MHAEFICSSGSLSDMDPRSHYSGYLALLRLVGTAYFLMNRSSYLSIKSPSQLYNSCQATATLEKHVQWLNKIREHVWVQTHEEKYPLPSHTALKQQWLRTVWVVHMWTQAGSKRNIDLLTLEQYVWKKS